MENIKISKIRFLLAFILIAAVLMPLVTMAFPEEKTISDYFFIRFYYDNQDEVLCTYKVEVAGTFSGLSSKINDVKISYESGKECEVCYSVKGNQVIVTLIHPTEGCLEKTIILNRDGTFGGY